MNYKFEYETQGAATFLVYQKQPQDVIDTMTMGMISNNKIEGVLPFIYMQIDHDTFFKYNVSSQNTLKQYFSGVVTKKRFLKVIESLLNCFILSEEYMLEASSVVLDSEYIFVNPNISEASVVVLPVVNAAESSVEGFMRNLVFSTQFDQSEDCSYIAALINFLNSNQFFSLHKFKDLVQDLLQEKEKAQSVKNDYKKVETAIPRTIEKSNISFTEVEKVVPQVFVTQKEENGQQQLETVITFPQEVSPQPQNVIVDIPNSKKEKKSLFAKKEKETTQLKQAKTGLPAPPPFTAGVPNTSVKNPPEPKPQKEKKSLFGRKEAKEPVKKKTSTMAIPGMQMPGKQSLEENDILENNSKSQELKKQTVIPVQDVQMKKHAVQMQDFGETVDLRSFSEGTTVLTGTTVLVNPVSEKKFFLKRMQTREVFELKAQVSKVGKDAYKNEICIQGNSAVSREHAVFYKESDKIFIEDLKSTNGTYLNGARLQPGIRSNPLMNGDIVRLGDEDLEIIVQS